MLSLSYVHYICCVQVVIIVIFADSKPSVFQGPPSKTSGIPSLRSPPTISSSPSSSSGSNSTTPTNDLGERGSPAGASNSNVNKGQSHSRKVLETPAGSGNRKTLFSPQPSRKSPPQFIGRIPESRSDLRLFKPTKQPTFTRRHTVSVAERIAQFGGPRQIMHRTYSPVNDDKILSSGGIGGLDPYKDIEEDKNSKPLEKEEGENGTNRATDVTSQEKGLNNPGVVSTQHPPASLSQQLLPSNDSNDEGTVTSSSQPVSPMSDQLRPTISSYPLTQPDRLDELVSPTSSIEELSYINQKRDLQSNNSKSHDPMSHDQNVPPNSQQSHQQRPIPSHHPVGYPNHTQQPPPSGTTYLPRPSQPLANVSHPLYYSSNSSQPLGIATANLALAHNAAAKGDITTLVCGCG